MNNMINEAEGFFQSNNLVKSEVLCHKVLRKEPKNIRAIFLKAKIAEKNGTFQESLKYLIYAIQLDPNLLQISDYLFQKMVSEEQYQWVLDKLELLSETQKSSVEIILCKGYSLERLGDFSQAINCYEQVLLIQPDNERSIMALGHASRFAGKRSESVEYYRQCIKLGRSLVANAYWSMSNLKDASFTALEINHMKELLSRESKNPKKASFLGFALGRANEDRKDFANSYRFYKLANEKQAELVSFNRTNHREYMKALVSEFSETKFVTAKSHNTGSKDQSIPIFIVGMPRSGSTLIEQILSSHSNVERAGELPYINRILWDMEANAKGTRYPALIKYLTDEEVIRYRHFYLQSVKKHRSRDTKYFVDKNPNNYENIGIIKKLFPEAIIIDSRRDYRANAFSLYKQLFIRWQEYSYKLDDIQAFYSDYLYLMNFWNKQFFNQVQLIKYETMVKDFESTVRLLLKNCGLEFEESCLKFYENSQAVDTASSEQVRKPIYSSSLETWKNYQQYYDLPAIEEL